jgi:hypothetical protein
MHVVVMTLEVKWLPLFSELPSMPVGIGNSAVPV